MNSCFSEKVAAIQVNPNQLSVETFPSGQVHDIKTDVHIKGVSCTKTHTVIWNGKKVAVYEVSENKSMVRAAGTFNSDSQKIGIHEQNIYLLEAEKMTVRTFQGTTKQELNFLNKRVILSSSTSSRRFYVLVQLKRCSRSTIYQEGKLAKLV